MGYPAFYLQTKINMETKKNPASDLNSQSGYFFSLGLLLSISLIASAFEWVGSDQAPVALKSPLYDNFNPLIEIPLSTTIPPPNVPAQQNPIITPVPDSEKISDVAPLIDQGNFQVVISYAAPEPERVDETIYIFAEESAAPKAGLSEFLKSISQKIKYPAQARRMGIEGRVFIEFLIGKDGTLSEIKVIKGIGGGCDEEALRVIQGSPNWNPGKQRGVPVKQRYTLPIVFKLG